MPLDNEFDIFRKEKSQYTPMQEINPKHTVNLGQSMIENIPDKPLILIVDDDSNIREALKITLEKKYDFILCSNGNEAIEKVHLPIFTVVLDIKMEGKNGFETFTEIKKKKLYLPIIFHSAYQDLKNPYEIMNDYRPFGYVVKDGDIKKLLDTIESAVNYYYQINRNSILIQELEKSERNYRELVENSLDIIFSLDKNGRILSINQSVTDILRYPIEEIINTNITNLTYKSNSPNSKILEEKLNDLSISHDVHSFNCDFVTKFGEPKEMHVKLRYSTHKNTDIIYGTASSIEEDILLRICQSESQVYKLENFLTHVDIISQRLANYASKYCNPELSLNLKLCLRELLINAMEHGNLGISFEEKSESLVNGSYIQMLIDRQKDPANANKRITVEYSLTPQKIEITITDEGNGFDYKKMLTRAISESHNQILGHGRGIAMSKTFLDSIIYNGKGNSVHIVKNF